MQTSNTLSLSPPPLKELAAIAFGRKKTILAALMIPPLLAVAALFVLPPTYRADAELMVKTGREYLPQTEGEGAASPPYGTKQEVINSEIELLTSRAMAHEVIQAIGLEKLYPQLVENPPWFGTVMDHAIKKFQRELSALPVKLSDVIDVTYEAEDPVKASEVLDTLIRIYLAKHSQVFATGHQFGYEEELRRETAELQRLEHEQAQIKLDSQIYDIGPQRAALIQQRVDAQTHLQDAIDRKATLVQRIATLTKQQAVVPATVKSTESDHSFQMDHNREALTDLQQSEAAIADRYGPDNPELQRIRAQIAALRSGARGLGDGLKVIVQPTPLAQQVQQELVMDNVELAPLTDEIARYRTLIAGYGQELDRLERADTALRLNSAQIEDVQANVTALRQRLNQARIENDLDAARMTSVAQIAPALTPDKPASPSPLIFLAAGVLGGLFAAGGIVVLSIIGRRTIYTEVGLERQFGLPVLASVDLVPTRRGQKPLLIE